MVNEEWIVNSIEWEVQQNGIQWNNTNDIKQKLLKIYHIILDFIKKSQEHVKILIPIAGICFCIMVFMIVKTVINLNELNKSSNELYMLDNYNINRLKDNENTKDLMVEASTINDLLEINSDVNDEIQRYENYFDDMQAPYKDLMSHILLPELNIWKDNYFGNIDTSVIGSKFLEKNPYNDMTLIDTWTNFFKSVWPNNEYNTIESIEIWDMVETNSGDIDIFSIPMTIKFKANSKRSFLLLVENLSITSNKKNISLISEFMYDLWDAIKKEKQNEIEKLKAEFDTWTDVDTIIWYNLYNWIKWNGTTTLLDNNVISLAIKSTATCNSETTNDYCMYKFRDKFRWIPSLAYTIGLGEKDNVYWLKEFLWKLPPIIKINSFTFSRDDEQDISNYWNIAYNGELEMSIYGKWISNDEVTEISEILWDSCTSVALTPEVAIQTIENRLVNIWNTVKIDAYSTSNLIELENIIQDIKKTFDSLSNYNKIIKLFEIYRMMREWNLCN